jgi:tetratricopeptide (TPR) repeat protein
VKEFPRNWRTALDLQGDLEGYYQRKKLEEKSNGIRKQIIASCFEILKYPKEAEDSGLPLGEVWMTIADMESKLGNKDSSKSAWEKSADYYKSNSKSSKDKMHQLYYAYVLSKLDRLKEADEVLESLQNHYPTDFTYYYQQANINFNAKKYEKAIGLSRKALQFAYENNRLKVVVLLAKAYKESGQSKDASQLIDDALQTIKVAENSRGSVARYAKQLRELQKTLIQ